jgi:hypothetical protein
MQQPFRFTEPPTISQAGLQEVVLRLTDATGLSVV